MLGHECVGADWTNPFGDGKAGERIVEILESEIAKH